MHDGCFLSHSISLFHLSVSVFNGFFMGAMFCKLGSIRFNVLCSFAASTGSYYHALAELKATVPHSSIGCYFSEHVGN